MKNEQKYFCCSVPVSVLPNEILPNYKFKELRLSKDLAIEMQHPNARVFHPRPRRQAQVQAILQWAFPIHRLVSPQFRSRNRGKPMASIHRRMPPLLCSFRDQSFVEIGPGQCRKPLVPVQRRCFPISIKSSVQTVTGRSQLCFGLWHLHPDVEGLFAGLLRDTENPDLHLRHVQAASAFGTHGFLIFDVPTTQKVQRRVTPQQFFVQLGKFVIFFGLILRSFISKIHIFAKKKYSKHKAYFFFYVCLSDFGFHTLPSGRINQDKTAQFSPFLGSIYKTRVLMKCR